MMMGQRQRTSIFVHGLYGVVSPLTIGNGVTEYKFCRLADPDSLKLRGLVSKLTHGSVHRLLVNV